MTQKELLYFEDAISHEDIIISILSESIKMTDDNELKSFFGDEKSKHIDIKNNLMTLLEAKNG